MTKPTYWLAGYWLVTFEWRSLGPHSSNEWRRENERIKGCVGTWWANYQRRCAEIEEKAMDKEIEYQIRGEEVPHCDRVDNQETRFVGAVPITKEGYDALEGVVG